MHPGVISATLMAWLVMTVHPEAAVPGTAATGEWTLSGLRSDAVSEIDSAASWYSKAVVPDAALGAPLPPLGTELGAAGVGVGPQEKEMVAQALVMVATRAAETTRTERRVVMVADLTQPRTGLGNDPVTVAGDRGNGPSAARPPPTPAPAPASPGTRGSRPGWPGWPPPAAAGRPGGAGSDRPP